MNEATDNVYGNALLNEDGDRYVSSEDEDYYLSILK